jgi:uncharacterized hydrophobic protein (TIGR00271 family)
MENAARKLKFFLESTFSLRKDKEDQTEITESIRRGIVFRGINVWVLIFAIFLASIGLNVNATAVIIGAMLISPLMGPIMGIGLGLGIYDFGLVKAAAKNLAIMVVISLITSTVYFTLSPLEAAQSELLSRTRPTIWDVLIAMFGGLAGIVAGASKEKGNVIPGVAIATALMPPLCTAGFGLARGDFYITLGAFYLFCINAVFISVSTFVVVRLLRFTAHRMVDPREGKRIRKIIYLIVVITVLPSVLIAYLTVQKAIYEQRAAQYIRNEFHFPRTYILSTAVDYENNLINLVLIGEAIPEDSLNIIRERARTYSLDANDVQITQGLSTMDETELRQLRSGIVAEIYESNKLEQDKKDQAILRLQRDLSLSKNRYPQKIIAAEVNSLYSGLVAFSMRDEVFFRLQDQKNDTVAVAHAVFARPLRSSERIKLEKWLKVRTQADSLLLILQ